MMEKIGRYHLRQELGKGTTGTVYLAEDRFIHRQVAIKTLRPDWLEVQGNTKQALELFIREARIIGQLNHSHITLIYDLGIQKSIPYFVMEYVQGYTLKEAIADELPFTLAEKVQLLAMLARALHYAHQRSILHADIKPANIIISEDRLPKITDFGIARLLKKQDDLSARSSDPSLKLCGTPAYMAPEQIRGEELDQRSDLFSLGVVAHEWLSGRKPFSANKVEDCLESILSDSPPPLAETGKTDQRLSDLLARTLAKKPADRYQSAEELSDSLELYLDAMERKAQAIQPGGRFSFDAAKIIDRLKSRYIFFADFSEEELFTLFQRSGKEQFQAGDYLVRENTPGTKMYIIISGSVSIITEGSGRRVELEKRLGEGSCVGEMAIIDRLPRSASVVALEKTLAIAINETVLRLNFPKLCLKLYRNLATILSERLRMQDQRIREQAASRPGR